MPTFPTYPGKLPKCLNPFNWRHYFLVLYWIFFRPTALQCYLYQADPELYRSISGKEIGAVFAQPSYRNLIVVASGSTVLFWEALHSSMMLFHIYHLAKSMNWGVVPDKVLFDFSRWLEARFYMLALFALIGAGAVFMTSSMVVGVSFMMAFPVVVRVGFEAMEWSSPISSTLIIFPAVGVAFLFANRFGIAAQVAVVMLHWILAVYVKASTLKLYLVVVGSIVLFSSLRLPIYILQGGGLLRAPWRGLHPIWWDELAVLPFLQIEVAIAQAWRRGEDEGLRRFAQLAVNPFQRWVAQRALILRLHDGAAPIHFLYRLFQIKELDAYAIVPLDGKEWPIMPSVLQIYLNELADVGPIGDGWVWFLTQPLRIKIKSPLVDLARLLHHLVSGIASSEGAQNVSQADDMLPIDLLPKEIDPDEFHPLLQSLLAYPGGEELQRSFSCMASCLRASSLLELVNGKAWFEGLPDMEVAIRPPVIEALGRFASIRQDIAVYEVASSRVNQLAALGRAIEALEELRVFIKQEVWSPEQILLQSILQRWRSLVSGASGRLGKQVVSKPVANPYVGGNPVANPYVAGNPVTGRLFVGRDDILRELEELWLSQGQVDSVVLYGHRRMGKSSILKNLPARLDSTYNRVVDFNLQQIGTVCSTGELLHALALEMRDHLPANGLKSPAVPNQETFEANPNRTFSDWLKTVAPLMVQHRFIVAIDEYELLEKAMAEGRIDASLTTYLRSVIQSTDWFVLVLAGLYSLEDKCHDYWHPLFASIKPRKVSFLSPAATRLLLCQPSEDFPLNYTADTIEEVVRLSNGQPYLVQLIGQNLVTRFNRQVFELGQDPERPISLDDLLAVIDSPDFFQDSSSYCKAIWKLAADAPLGQQVILKALAHESKDLQQLIAETGLSEDAAKEALSTLTAHDVVLRLPDAQRYGFTVELMRRWVLHTNILQQ
jgi:hypothetical protein